MNQKYTVFVHFLRSGIDKEYLIRHFFLPNVPLVSFFLTLERWPQRLIMLQESFLQYTYRKLSTFIILQMKIFFNHRQMWNMLQWKRYLH